MRLHEGASLLGRNVVPCSRDVHLVGPAADDLRAGTDARCRHMMGVSGSAEGVDTAWITLYPHYILILSMGWAKSTLSRAPSRRRVPGVMKWMANARRCRSVLLGWV